jgi:ligand-binding sensor domain-containing protein
MATNKYISKMSAHYRPYYWVIYRKNKGLFLFFLWLSPILHGQNYNYTNYNSKQGLPSSEVYCTAQDSSGYIWFGTDAGVCRFDGTQFKKFTTEDGLADNTVLHIYVDYKGRVWFGTFSGGISYYHNDSMHTIAASDSLKKIIAYGLDFIISMYVDHTDRLWLGLCSRGGIIYMDKQNNYEKIQPYICDSAYKQIVFVGNRPYPIYAGTKYLHKKRIHVNTPGGVIILPINQSVLLSNRMKIFYSNTQVLYFSFFDYLYVVKNNQLLYVKQMPDYITDIYVDDMQGIWVAAYKKGLYRYNNFDFNQPTAHYFNGLTVSDCMYDAERGFWITTIEKGVYYVPSSFVKRIEITSDQDPNFTSVFTLANKIIVSSGSGDMYTYQYDSITHFFKYTGIFYKNKFYAYKAAVNKNKILLASGKFDVLNLNGGNFKEIRVNNNIVNIKDIFITPNKSVLAVGLNYLVELDSLFDVKYYKEVPTRSHAIIKTSRGEILIGTANGVWKLKNDSFVYQGNNNPLLKYRTDDILEDCYHNLWFVTREAGVVVRIGAQYYHINKEVGLVSNQCSGIVQDAVGNIWISTYEGLSKISMRQGIPNNIENYTIFNGLNSNEVKSIFLFKDYILLINTEGIDFFRFDAPLKNTTPPPVYIQSAWVDDKKMDLDGTIHSFGYKSRIIEFKFSALTFTSLGFKTYLYRLEGYDAQWRYTHEQTIQYTNLPTGNYKFLVYGVNNNGVMSKVPAEVVFIITEPWWRSWTFYILLNVGLVLMVLLGTLLYVRYLKRKSAKKSRIDQMLAESRLIALRAQMNPHFIFNVINSIQYYVLQNEKDRAYDYLARFSRLIRLVLDSSQYLKIPLAREIEILKYYVELEKLRFGSLLEIEIKVEVTNTNTAMIPNMIIQPYVENAIIHGLLHKTKDAVLKINIQEDLKTNCILVVITDNGIGRARAMKNKKDSEFVSTGMIITSERLKVIQKLSDVAVKVKIIDLVDELSNPLGTKVEITIPINNT